MVMLSVVHGAGKEWCSTIASNTEKEEKILLW